MENFTTGSREHSPATPLTQTPDLHTGAAVSDLKQAIRDNVFYIQGKIPRTATLHDYYMAVAHAVRDRLQRGWVNTIEAYVENDVRIACYLSAEYLLGPHLGNNLLNLGITEPVRQAVTELGLDFDALLAQEEEPGLGNGGLGRLAACFLDSLATLEMPAFGYGIRYEFGIFDQEIREGRQVEITDKWLRLGNPWEIAKPELALYVPLGGRTRTVYDDAGHFRVEWIPASMVKGIPYDTPIAGFRVNTVNTLRLWSAEAPESFDFQAFNTGDYYEAVEEKIVSETVTKVLYPNDEPDAGKRLRLTQQYFFVSCALQDMLRILQFFGSPMERFPDTFAVQLNDTHPTIAVAELMRLLVDVHDIPWDTAWDITTRALAYTNHTLLSEALETWPVDLFGALLPRHLEIIYEINRRFLDEVRAKYPGDADRVSRMSIIDEQGGKRVRMAHLACAGTHSVNGVAALHTRLLREHILSDFDDMMPGKFTSITNGVTPRRFLALCNPGLRELITGRIGDRWLARLEDLRGLEPHADDPEFRKAWRAVKQTNKQRLADQVLARTGIRLDPESLFDIMVKRIHEYKRQHLNVIHIIRLYRRLKENPGLDIPARSFIFAGKAAPGYDMAKRIIRLITGVAEVVNHDPDVAGRIRVAFVPDFNVKNAQAIYPAADLSEQISMAGKEASGTGNMKFTLNGALTIGTLDGANVEIREAVGAENFFLFGLTAEAVYAKKRAGYRPWDYEPADSELRGVIGLIETGAFSGGDRGLFRPLVDSLRGWDEFMVFADFVDYVACQDAVGNTWRETEKWTRMSILNTARAGMFSSDRAIREYCERIWKVTPVTVEMKY